MNSRRNSVKLGSHRHTMFVGSIRLLFAAWFVVRATQMRVTLTDPLSSE